MTVRIDKFLWYLSVGMQFSSSYFSSCPSIVFGAVIITVHGSTSYDSWWRHQMEAFSALLAICAGNSPVPVNSPHKGQWRGALMFSLICIWINDWVNNGEAGDLRRYRGHYDVIVMFYYHIALRKCACSGTTHLHFLIRNFKIVAFNFRWQVYIMAQHHRYRR